MALPLLAPQIYCHATGPSKFKLWGAEAVDHAEQFSKKYPHISSWLLFSCTVACPLGLRALKVMRIIPMKPNSLLKWCAFLVTLTAFTALALLSLFSGYLLIARFLSSLLHRTKPSDENYKKYLMKLSERDIQEVTNIIKNAIDKRFSAGSSLQNALDTLITLTVEKYLQLPEPDHKALIVLIRYASPATQDALYAHVAEQLKIADALTTISMVDSLNFNDPSISAEIQGDTVEEKRTHVFKHYAESELTGLSKQRRCPEVFEALSQIGFGRETGELPHLIVRYYDDETYIKTQTILAYTIQTRYTIDGTYVSTLFYPTLHKVSQLFIHHQDYRNFEKVITAFLPCFPKALKCTVITEMKQYPAQWEAVQKRIPWLEKEVETLENDTSQEECLFLNASVHGLSLELSDLHGVILQQQRDAHKCLIGALEEDLHHRRVCL